MKIYFKQKDYLNSMTSMNTKAVYLVKEIKKQINVHQKQYIHCCRLTIKSLSLILT